MLGKLYAPIILFVYNRPDHVRQTVDALQKNDLASESELFIYSDGQKADFQSKVKVDQVRSFIKTITGFKKITIIKSPQNKGLADSIIQGVTEIVNQYGTVIVLEDDLEVSPDFLRFMNDALDVFKDEQKVMQVSGHTFDVKIKAETDAVFLPFPTSWGWATWQRAWGYFDASMSGYEKIENDKQLKYRFNLDGAYNYFSMLENQLLGKIDSWAIRWYLSFFLNNGLALFPVRSLVRNIGFDGSGTHCEKDNGVYAQCCARLPRKEIHFPPVVMDHDAYSRVKMCLAPRRTDSRNIGAVFEVKKFLAKVSNLNLTNRFKKKISHFLSEKEKENSFCCIQKENVTFHPESIVRNNQNIREAIQIGSYSHIRGELMTFGHGGEIIIGEYCYIGEGSKIWSDIKIDIGDRVLISHQVNVFDNLTHPISATERHRQFTDIIKTGHPKKINLQGKPVSIQNDAWIGCLSIILRGLTIGEGAIVGAGSVVTKDVPPWTIVAGNPARIIREIPEDER